jgi:5'-nucleotidase
MNILITNDDGISSPALARLAAWAKKHGNVTVVAPKFEQSGKSHAIEFFREMEIKKIDMGCDVEAYSVDSTPADCVRFAVLGLHKRYDLVLSGVNRGFNLGADIVYSGTAGAIFEAARLGLSGIALSTDFGSFEPAFSNLDKVYAYITEDRLLMLNPLYNVNFPEGGSEIRITRQGGMFYTDEFVPLGNDMYKQEGHEIEADGNDLDADINAVRGGYISITPLTIDRTAREVYRRLKNTN